MIGPCPVCGKPLQYKRLVHYLPGGGITVGEVYECPDAFDFRHRPPDETESIILTHGEGQAKGEPYAKPS